MWVGIAAPHQRAPILEDLDMANGRQTRQFPILLHPDIHDTTNLNGLHPWDRQVMPGREADDPADARLGLGDDQALPLDLALQRLREKRGVVIIENQGVLVLRISSTPGAHISGAQVAIRIVGGAPLRGTPLLPPQPGPLGSLG
jgi:hypothetical protein